MMFYVIYQKQCAMTCTLHLSPYVHITCVVRGLYTSDEPEGTGVTFAPTRESHAPVLHK